MSKGLPGVDREWQAQEDLRALKTVEEVRGNRKRYSAVQQLLKKEQAALARVGRSAGVDISVRAAATRSPSKKP